MKPYLYGNKAHRHYASKIFRQEITGEYTLVKDAPGIYVLIEDAERPGYYWRNYQINDDRTVTMGEFTSSISEGESE